MAEAVRGGRPPGVAQHATFAGARLLLSSDAAHASDGVDEELLGRHGGAPTVLPKVRALLGAGPAGSVEDNEELYELGLPRDLDRGAHAETLTAWCVLQHYVSMA